MAIVLPPSVVPGDCVGIAALSGAVDAQHLQRGVEELRRLGYVPVLADNLKEREGIFAGNDAARLDAFHGLARRPDVRAIFFARGGHGVLRLLPRIDWELLARFPRAYVGYSDLTPFLLGVVQRSQLVAFHGPMVAGDLARGLSEEEASSLQGALAGELPRNIAVPHFLQAGSGEGVLLGGCASLLVALQGTPFAPDLDGALLFLEDVNEPAYRIDRMLTHLHLSGNLTKLHGMVLGYLGAEWDRGATAEWQQWFTLAVPGPVGAGIACGHGAVNLTLPLGLPARLDASCGELRVG